MITTAASDLHSFHALGLSLLNTRVNHNIRSCPAKVATCIYGTMHIFNAISAAHAEIYGGSRFHKLFITIQAHLRGFYYGSRISVFVSVGKINTLQW